MTDRVQIAVALRGEKGYNCAQAVLAAYADLFGLDESTALKIAEGFGTGMGGMGETCGALTAAYMLVGLMNATGSPDKAVRADTYKKVRELTRAFENETGATLCRELKGESGRPPVPCPVCVATAARLFEETMNRTGKAAKIKSID